MNQIAGNNSSKSRLLFYFALASVCLFIFYEYMLRVSDSVIVPELMRTFHIQAAGIGLLSASYYLVYIGMQVPAGLLLDRFKLRSILFFAIASVALGSLLFASTHNLPLAIFARVAMGVGSAFAFISGVKIIQELIRPRCPSFWIGMAMTIATLGAVCGQEPWLLLTRLFGSWQHVYLLAAGCGLILVLLTWWLIPQISSEAPAPISIITKKRLRLLFARTDFWLLIIYMGLLSAPITAFVALWGVSFLNQGLQYSREAAASIMAFSWIGGLFGGPLLGYFADYFKIRQFVLISIGMVASLIVFVILLVPISDYFIQALLFFILGLICNGNVIVFAIVAEKANRAHVGFVTGIANSFNMGGGPVFQLVVGMLLTLQHGLTWQGVTIYTLTEYQRALLIIPLFLLVSTLSLCLLQLRKYRS